jgi:hypothetical protein
VIVPAVGVDRGVDHRELLERLDRGHGDERQVGQRRALASLEVILGLARSCG